MAKRRQSNPRPIRTDYYLGGKVVKTNKSVHANSAAKNCFDHLQTNDYEATVGEVWDEDTGELHAVFRRKVGGEADPVHISTVFKREPEPKE